MTLHDFGMTFYEFRMTFEGESHAWQMASYQALWQIVRQLYDFYEFRATFFFYHSHLVWENLWALEKKKFLYSKWER